MGNFSTFPKEWRRRRQEGSGGRHQPRSELSVVSLSSGASRAFHRPRELLLRRQHDQRARALFLHGHSSRFQPQRPPLASAAADGPRPYVVGICFVLPEARPRSFGVSEPEITPGEPAAAVLFLVGGFSSSSATASWRRRSNVRELWKCGAVAAA